mmetsp:Transcript_16795/g.26201  ORF Transcript_16795/g.26201 Transcript_16795/m.26201 type:complete len:368 (+) Transcript_16795:106-1209(+)
MNLPFHKRIGPVFLISSVLILSSESFHVPPRTYSNAFVYPPAAINPKNTKLTVSLRATVAESETKTTNDGSQRIWYKRADGNWKPRIDIRDLKIGQRLFCTKLRNELLDGKTGPKLFYECGVGQMDSNGKWQVINGMLRLGKAGMKSSVVKKKKSRLKAKADDVSGLIPLYVSRVHLANGKFEVSTEIPDMDKGQREKIPASSLQPGQELIGTVKKVKPYGVFVDVGASRNGLLHISTVAELFGCYVNKEKGLTGECGLERGAKIQVAVQSNVNKRLALDFTQNVKDELAREREREAEAKLQAEKEKEKLNTKVVVEIADVEANMWAQFAAAPGYVEEEDKEVDYDYDYSRYDEERDIEDSLGLDSY